ncbi:MafI family immunity protein [Pseudomonas syringae]|uniref:MafI family immunity protein n=1 Tax=Pseudomonas syringae TaxID=317 RepID=UPI0034D77269
MDSDLLQGALGYVAYNEESLAFEVLCDHICEYDISITDEEYNEAVRLILDIGLDLDDGPFKHLLGLKK